VIEEVEDLSSFPRVGCNPYKAAESSDQSDDPSVRLIRNIPSPCYVILIKNGAEFFRPRV